jgi:hypothetical protein
MSKPSCSMYTPGLSLLCFLHRWYGCWNPQDVKASDLFCDVCKRGWWHSCLRCLSKTDRLAAGCWLNTSTAVWQPSWLQNGHRFGMIWASYDWGIEGLIIGTLFNRFLMFCPFSVISFLFLASPWQGVNRKSPALLVCRDGLRTDLYLLELLDWWSNKCTVLLP